MTLDLIKDRFRGEARLRRQIAVQEANPGAVDALASNVLATIKGLKAGSIIAGYLAIGDEIDVLPVMEKLLDLEHQCALPVVTGQGVPLKFRLWHPGIELEAGPLKTRHPVSTGSDVEPDILLVPMLAFDTSGHRMGWGGGYYDRTLASLRPQKDILAIGVAYAGQQAQEVPRGDYDQALDWVVTEQSSLRITES